MQGKTLLILACLVLLGPPLIFTCISLFLLFMYLTEPWGWFLLFLLLGLPLGTLLVGAILWYGNRHEVMPRAWRHMDWRPLGDDDEPQN